MKSSRWTTRSSSRASVSSAGRLGQDHAAHHGQAVLAQEHVLGAAQADALGPELAGVGRVVTGVGVGPHGQVALADVVGPRRARSRRRPAAWPRSAAPGPTTTMPAPPSRETQSPSHSVTPPGAHRAVAQAQHLGADDGRLAPAPGHHGGVADQAAPGGEDALGGQHAVHVLGRGLVAHQDDLLAALGRGRGVVGAEVDAARRRHPGWPRAPWPTSRSPTRRTGGGAPSRGGPR